MKATNVNLLEELKKEELSDFRDIFTEVCFYKGQIIFTPNEDQNMAFIISSGRVRVYLAYGDKEFSLSILGVGEVYSTHTQCYVEVLDDCCVLMTKVESLSRFMTKVPSLTRTMLRVLGRTLKNSLSIIGSLAFKDINKRLIDYIIYKADLEKAGENACKIELGLTIEQLASLMGASRQTISTLLNALERDTLIKKIGRGQYTIKDIDALRNLSL
ncbi:MAG: Crp/Fnr family transcriptional regulator [Desulfotalea sp.]